ncbi:MAG: helix-turn-helix domain-containing protein [Pseudonocardia sp.]|nr:helix-turn-helix domain-containing protein [Pseudonocardia sp.]
MIDSSASLSPPDDQRGGEVESANTELDEDRIRVAVLARMGADSPEAVAFMEELFVYGIGTLLNLCYAGAMPGKLRQLVSTIQLESPPPMWTEDNWRNSAVAAVQSVAAFFIDDLLDGSWQPERGARIKTYFVNTCCLAFVNEYRKEIRRLARAGGGSESPAGDAADLDLYVVSWLRNAEPNTEQTALAREQIRDLLAQSSHESIPEIVFLLAQGYSQRDIATHLGRSEVWVSRALDRFRRAVREWRSKWS